MKLEWKARKEVSKKNAEKYHYVRFVEKKKLTRKIRTIREELVKLVSQKKDTADLEKQLHLAQDDMMYVQRFPLDAKYISLFPSTPLSEEAAKLQQEMKDKIKLRKANRDGLEARLAAKALNPKVTPDEFFDSGRKAAPVKRKASGPKPTLIARAPVSRPLFSNSKQDAANHPSWAAKADPKQKGSLTGFEGKRQTFDEED